ncbi:unnamed protein product [Clonostachys rosea]|uniref:2,2-dialkylglycine decarboxylase n=1 Tax=Bionectria ochroleuca TaxID=29856 RepID=A0ABY6URC0_BIOOC|nr:unnamed protein product [Clonostachys rosea]
MAKCFTGDFEIVAFYASYHGLTQGSGSAAYSAGHKNGEPVVPGQTSFPAPYPYRSVFRKPDGLLEAYGEECKKRGMLVIMDEAQTGVGRTGQMFVFEHDELVPDILCLSKTLSRGLPLASVTTTAEIERGCRQAGLLWLTTHLNDPLTGAVGERVLEIVERDNIPQKATERSAKLRDGLLRLQEKYWCIGEVRGRGLFQAIEIISDAETKTPGPELGQAVSDRALQLGLSCNAVNLPGMGCVFRLAPPVTVTREEIDAGLALLDQAFQQVLEERGLFSKLGQKKN